MEETETSEKSEAWSFGAKCAVAGVCTAGIAAGALAGIALAPAAVVGSTMVAAATAPTYFLGIPWSFLMMSAGTAAVYAPVTAVTPLAMTCFGIGGGVVGGAVSAASVFVGTLFGSSPTHAPDASERDEYPVPDYLQEAIELGQVNVAVTGQAGVGKSALINAIRKMKKNDPGYAPVGIVETTRVPTMYRFPNRIGIMRRIPEAIMQSFRNNDNPDVGGAREGDWIMVEPHGHPERNNHVAEIISVHPGEFEVRFADADTMMLPPSAVKGMFADANLWDLPGTGTPLHPQQTYLKEKGIRYFDLVLLVTAGRFTEAEQLLKRELDHWNVPYFLVRSMVDQAVDAKISEEGEAVEGELSEERKQEIKHETVDELKEYFRKDYSAEKVYAISTQPRLRDEYDFRQLERDIGSSMMNSRGVTLEMECPICMLTYSDFPEGTAGARRELRPCGHTLCENCARDVQTCPICRGQVAGD